jgi:Ala-tRNA(Pro) deacylase
MPNQAIKEFLDNHHIKYSTIQHTPAYTAPEIAATSHVRGRNLAKVVVVKLDGKLAMVVEAAHEKVNLERLKKITSAKKIELASEYEFKDKFSDCELGAMPPFGNLYHMDVYVSETLTRDGNIVFNAGTHSELIKMSFRDFVKLVHPHILKH